MTHEVNNAYYSYKLVFQVDLKNDQYRWYIVIRLFKDVDTQNSLCHPGAFSSSLKHM